MVQQRSNLFGRVRAGSSGGLHHNARIFQSLLFGVLSQLATNDVRSPEVARKKNRDKNKIKEDQEFEYPHKRATEGAKIMLVTRSMQLQKSALIPRTRIRKSIDLSASFCEAIKSAQEKGDRSSGVAEFRSGSPVGLYCARIRVKKLGDLSEKMFHLCYGAITQ